MSAELRIVPIKGIGEIPPGTDLGVLIYEALQTNQLSLQQGDIVVVTQKNRLQSRGANRESQ